MLGYISECPWTSLFIGGILLYGAAKAKKWVLLAPGMFYFPKEKAKPNYEPGIVYLHHWPEAWTRQVPNMSPYSMKLETWLRLRKIKYEVVETMKPSKVTKQIPYIIYNDQHITESNNIIEVMSKLLKLDNTDGLSAEQQGVSRSMQRMVEDSTAWTIFMDRYIYKPDLYTRVARLVDRKPYYERFQRLIVSEEFKKRANLHGIGRQTKEMVERTGKADVKAVADYLGEKKFIMGDKITTADCTIFGHLCQVAYTDFPYFHKEMFCDNMIAYLDRIRDSLWPDWSTRVNPLPFDN